MIFQCSKFSNQYLNVILRLFLHICVGISIIQEPYVFEITGSVANLKKLKNTNYNIYVCMHSITCAHKPKSKTTLLDACRPHLCLLVNFFTMNTFVYEFSILACTILTHQIRKCIKNRCAVKRRNEHQYSTRN